MTAGALSRWQKIALLSALYFVQGLPYGFQSAALPNYLRKSGVSLTHIGFAGALAMPWAFKVFWAPLVDRHGSPAFGRRKSWIVPLQGLMGLCCFAAAFCPPQGFLAPLLALIFALNLFAATQDIAVDGLAVSLLDESELGLGNAVQVVGYKLGMLTGGGLLVAASVWVGWNGLFFAMGALCLLVMFGTLAFREQASTPPHQPHPSLSAVLGKLLEALKLPGTAWLLVFVASYKVGEVMADKMFGPYLIDHGISEATIGLWVGTYGMAASLSGSLLGGLLASRWRLLAAVGLTAALRVVPLVLQWALTAGLVPVEPAWVVGITCTEHFFAGALTTAMFAFMMSKVNRSIGATHYTLLASVEVVGKTPGGLLSGKLADATSYGTVNAVAALASAAFLLLLVPMGLRRRHPG